MDQSQLRPTHVEIDLDMIQRNVSALHQMAPGARFMAVVKADGYGHGAIPVAQAALAAGASWLGVAFLEEGVQLRKAGLTAPILIFGYVPPSQAETVVLHDLRPAVFHLELAEALAKAGQAHSRKVPVHLKVDTGMGRIGVQPAEAVTFARALTNFPWLTCEGIFTHLATADEPDNAFASQQLDLFADVLGALREAGLEPPIRHACNSAGIMLHPSGHLDLVRAGIALYGLPPDPVVDWPLDLQPALTWRTRIAHVKTVEPGTPISYGCTYRAQGRERIATLPVGYADGLSRLLTNRGEVLIGGRRCPIVGRVCMDQTMVRLPDDLEAAVGDEVILIGSQGAERITAGEMARLIGTINYEVVCAISKRVPRIYQKDGNHQNQEFYSLLGST